MGERQPAVSEAEGEVLKVLWEEGPGTVRAVHAELTRRGRAWAYTTVQTLLGRLEGKGYVRCDRSGAAHVFEAAVSRDGLLGERLRGLADQFCDGTTSPLLLALVEGGLTPEEIQDLRRLIDELDPPRKKRRPS